MFDTPLPRFLYKTQFFIYKTPVFHIENPTFCIKRHPIAGDGDRDSDDRHACRHGHMT